MVNFYNYFKTAFMAILMIAAIACSKDDDSVPDPEGTLTANISNDSELSVYYPNGSIAGGILWTSPNNFWLLGYNIWSLDHHANVSICDLGKMSGLGNITSIPSSGFTAPSSSNSVITCEPRHGYIVKCDPANYRPGNPVVYVRLYVVESIVSTSGGIMGAKIRYQYPFEP
ncbi:MAG: hypothetical protein LBC68_05210 [Prevotellaceae bacterium]|jgi:hypothetical protein|nr:hypothetical protein [Prevotellaceae bacterium]